jgi:ABC-type glycerol-3-phosphate transport system substrate-binding protein
MNNFNTILIAVFLAFFVLGVLIFSGAIKIPDRSNKPQGKVVLWGTFPGSAFNTVLESINSNNLSLSYVEKDKATYQQDLIEAFANGSGPDIYIITPDLLRDNANFLYKIPYASYQQKVFTDSFIDGANIYLDKDGILGLPLVVDPIVLYYNKDTITNEGIVSPPLVWSELFKLNSSLTRKENNGTINQSMIALGQYNNINNVKDILATLLIQNNNPIIERGADSNYKVLLNMSNLESSGSTTESIMKFFLEFSNPSITSYSWNRSLPNSLDMFISGKLAFYIGRASELFDIQSMNPNLSFDVAQIPQVEGYTAKRTYGEIYAIVFNKKSLNISSSLGVAQMLSTGEYASNLSASLSLPPASKALLSVKPETNSYLYTFFNSALISKSWLDPNKTKSGSIFKEMVENILSNNLSINSSIDKAQGQLELLFTK